MFAEVTSRRHAFALALLAFIGANCGRTPAAPTASVSASLSASADFVLVGQSVELTARDAQTQALIAVPWRNLTPEIASLNGNVLTGVRNGEAIVSAGGNSSASLNIRVIDNFGGLYPGGRKANGDPEMGSAYVVECIDFIPTYCAFNALEERLGKGPQRFAMRLVQSRDTVTGDVFIDCGGAIVSGAIDVAGRLNLRGAFVLKGPPGCHIEDWSTWLVDGRAYGRFKSRSSGGLVTFELRGVTRTIE